jgi:hypothetical protein
MSQCGACEELPAQDSSLFMVSTEGVRVVVKPEKRT